MSSSCQPYLRKTVPLLTVALLAALNFGCGSQSPLNRKAISGHVNVDGVPLAHGIIRMVPQAQTSGPGVMAEIIEGKFSLEEEFGPVPGLHRVEIEATQHLSFEIDNEAAFAAAVQRTGRSPVAINPIPAVYNRNSVLTANIADIEHQVFPFDLKSKP